jgi:hypothetical protein
MAARRCAPCGHYWPNLSEYVRCPVCHKATTYLAVADSMGERKARRIVTRIKWKHHYAAHDKKRTGLTPEELGRQDAEPEIKKIREMHLTVRQIRDLPEYEGEREIEKPRKPKKPRFW